MKVLITGAGGQLGRELQGSAPPDCNLVTLNHVGSKSGHVGLDITDAAAVDACFKDQRPDVVVNTAAYTNVDQAETEPQAAFAINSEAAAGLARSANRWGTRLIHISTDFVFDGQRSSPYLPADPGAPLSVYGSSKWEGEQRIAEITNGAALVIRSAWLYSSYGSNFVTVMLRLLREQEELRVVADQVGTPTWARSLARAIWAAVSLPQLCGIYHWTDAGVASWYDFAVAIQAEALSLGLLPHAIPIYPIRTQDYPRPARRPSYSVLDKTSAWRDLHITSPHWRYNLRDMLTEIVAT
ncbi:MAG: dTDP-4-dehydrorhamnose reductase [Gammaproteobacteria bacterium]